MNTRELGKFKICSKCKIEKELSEFHKDKNTNDGHCYKCKTCVKIYREQNSIHLKELNKKWRIINREHKLAMDRKYCAENKENLYYNLI